MSAAKDLTIANSQLYTDYSSFASLFTDQLKYIFFVEIKVHFVAS